jgi:hypothetical protein
LNRPVELQKSWEIIFLLLLTGLVQCGSFAS